MSRVYRCFTEKRTGFQVEAAALAADIRQHLGVGGLSRVRILNRYDVQGITDEVYRSARVNVFSEPQCDDCYDEELPPGEGARRSLAVEFLPGQYDQRADSCAQGIQIMAGGSRPAVRTARLYLFYGDVSDAEMDRIRAHLINPVESREASLGRLSTLSEDYGTPPDVPVLAGLTEMDARALEELRQKLGLAMDADDLLFLQDYFKTEERRDPTLTELRMIDTYWSDHCRHTTFSTRLNAPDIRDPAVAAAFESYRGARRALYGEREQARPITLMDIATCGMKYLKKRGVLKNLDESEEINACSVRVTVRVDGRGEDYLLMFKNETHNHPTEIEPFGGAATCLGGAIRDPLSGRSYVYQAMRVTGSADPRTPLSKTIPGKLPQRRITQGAAAGYSSYGNQIGLATGLVHEVYHPDYVAKRMEIGAVVGAAPAENVVRERPVPGDLVILLGGRTGRDGCGGATGSSKSHTRESLATCGAEVQKGNAPEERKLQRLFRKSAVTRMIKRCNDFGAGGVSVAIGELADGLDIDLDRVPKKYDGLDGTELAISESQERMAVVVAAEDAPAFIREANAENLEATVVAAVTGANRLRMRWRGKTVVDVGRPFLSSNGASRSAGVRVDPLPRPSGTAPSGSGTHRERLLRLLSDLNVCSQRGLGERFDGSIGASAVLAPYGGKTGLAPSPVMISKFPVLTGETTTVSAMAFGYDPYLSGENPFAGAACAVVESVAGLIAAGFSRSACYLSLQEYFERLGADAARWGKPFASLLGAFSAQCGLGVAAIGGKDSMSGSYMDLDVPPTLVSFAVAAGDAADVVTGDFQGPGHPVCWFRAPYRPDGTPDYPALCALLDGFSALCAEKRVLSARAVGFGGCAEAVFKLCIGNTVGFAAEKAAEADFYLKNYGGIVAECTEPVPGAVLLGRTTPDAALSVGGETVPLAELIRAWERPLEEIFPVRTGEADPSSPPALTYASRNPSRPAARCARPLAVIPVFPGTNCEYDTARAVERAGGQAEIVVVRNLTPDMLADSVREMAGALARAQMLILPGGFSGGDEPDGSGKFIAAFFRNARLTDAVHALLRQRDGLILGICNGFQALIKLGLVPYGEIRPMDAGCPTLTYNLIGRHQARYVTTRVASVLSPWLSKCEPGELHTLPVSHGEGRFVASDATAAELVKNGQIAFQYVDPQGAPSMDIAYNPNGSLLAVEGITSRDGRILGKMAHTERIGRFVGMNIPGSKFQPLFEGGVDYFR